MSFNRSGYIGRAPGDSSIVLAKQYFQPTGAGRTFTFTSGYDPGLLDVYRNGVKLINVLDYAATDGSTVILDTPVGVGSTVQIVAYKGFNVTEVSSNAGDFTVGSNLYVQSGFGSFSNGLTANQINVTGIGTIGIGSFTDINVSGGATVEGTLVAGSFSGDGSALTGVGQTLNVRTESLTVAGVSTLTGAANFSAAVNVDATTDSTSSSTGALIVDGGLGVAKNVYIGAGLSVAGTLTYEDVTSVDSVGMVTAKSGVNITGGELTVGSGITMGIAGVATFSGTSDVHLHDNVRLNIGDSSDLQIFHNGSDDTNRFYLSGKATTFWTGGSNNHAGIKITDGEAPAVELYYDNSVKLATTNDGTVTTGISTVDGLRLGDSEYISVGAGGTGDLQISHNGTDSIIKNTTGRLDIKSDSYLYLESDDRVYIGNVGQTKVYANFIVDGAVNLYHNNNAKFATTNDGVVITGITTCDGLRMGDDERIKLGNSEDLSIYHHTSHDSYVSNATGFLSLRSTEDVRLMSDSNEFMVKAIVDGAVEVYYDNSKKLATTNEGIEVTGFTSTTAGMGVTGGLFEGSFIKAGKLSDNATLGISTANFFYFTTQETTTATPNIVWNDSYSLSSKMAVGDVASVTVVTTAAAGGYAANWTIDGNAVTEEWVGGSAPSAGGSDGLDIYSLTIIKTGTGTGDSGFKVIGNLSNAT